MILKQEQENQIKDYLEKRPEVAAAVLYGSQVKKQSTPLSDVDLGILLQENIEAARQNQLRLTYIENIEAILGQDLGADVKFLDEYQSLYYLAEVFEGGRVLVMKDEAKYRDLITRVAIRYPDYYRLLNQYHDCMRERVMEGSYAAGHI